MDLTFGFPQFIVSELFCEDAYLSHVSHAGGIDTHKIENAFEICLALYSSIIQCYRLAYGWFVIHLHRTQSSVGCNFFSVVCLTNLYTSRLPFISPYDTFSYIVSWRQLCDLCFIQIKRKTNNKRNLRQWTVFSEHMRCSRCKKRKKNRQNNFIDFRFWFVQLIRTVGLWHHIQ